MSTPSAVGVVLMGLVLGVIIFGGSIAMIVDGLRSKYYFLAGAGTLMLVFFIGVALVLLGCGK